MPSLVHICVCVSWCVFVTWHPRTPCLCDATAHPVCACHVGTCASCVNCTTGSSGSCISTPANRCRSATRTAALPCLKSVKVEAHIIRFLVWVKSNSTAHPGSCARGLGAAGAGAYRRACGAGACLSVPRLRKALAGAFSCPINCSTTRQSSRSKPCCTHPMRVFKSRIINVFGTVSTAATTQILT